MNQSKKGTSLSSKHLSPLAKPFTFHPSTSTYSSNHSNDDPFSSSLDSFQNIDLGSEDDYKVSTLPTQTHENYLFEQHPSLEFQKDCDFYGLNWSHFDIMESTYSPNVTGLGYGKQRVDSHESSLCKGNDGLGSVDNGSMLQQGKHGDDGLNTSLAESDGIIGGKDILSNSIGTSMDTVDESSSFPMLHRKVPLAPLKLSTTDMSTVKNTSQIQTSENSGDHDSDVDSPCWKGTMALCPTPSKTSGSEKVHRVEKATEKNNSLNPQAPQFFPGIGYIKGDFVLSKSSAPVTTKLLPGEGMLMKSVMADSPLELNKRIVLQASSYIRGREKVSNMLNERKCSSVNLLPKSHSMPLTKQSSSKEDCSASKGKLATIVDVDNFVNGTNDPRASGSISGVLPAKSHSSKTTSTIPSSRVGVATDHFKALENVSKSLMKSPNPDCQMIISAMHVFSELLLQTCEDSVNLCNERNHNMIQQIMNNLGIISMKTRGQTIPSLVSSHADIPYCLDRSLEHPEMDYMQKNSVSKVFARSGHNSFASSSDHRTEKNNEIGQFIRRSIGKSVEFEKQMPSEALLFRNLWLDCEAERCYRRYKTYRCLMEAGIDVNCTNVKEHIETCS